MAQNQIAQSGFFANKEDDRLSVRMRLPGEDLRAKWRQLDARIGAFDAEFARMAREDEASRWLATIPGSGVITATALIAALGDARGFCRGRDLAAWLGLVPRQATASGKPRTLGISKRGNRYLRGNLIHGARAVLPGVLAQETPLGRWAWGLSERAHRNVVVVALAAKLARIVWAVLRSGRPFDTSIAAAAA